MNHLLHRNPAALSAVALAMAMCTAQVHAVPALAHWTIVDIGTLGGDFSAAYGINDAGQVAGGATTAGNDLTRALIYSYSTGSLTNLGILRGNDLSNGNAINATGVVTGYSGGRAFVYAGTNMVDLGTLGFGSSGFAINAAGQVTGYSDTGTATHAFLYSGGGMTDLGTLGGTISIGRGINGAGQVVGSSTAKSASFDDHAFLYTNGAMSSLGTLGGSQSVANAINDAGQITGWADTTGNRSRNAFVYRIGTMTDIGTLGGSFAEGRAINAAGLVVGASTLSGSSANRAFLYSNGRMSDLNSFNGIAGTGWNPSNGQGINNVGQIVGYGSNPGGLQRGFVATLDTTVWESAASGSWDDSANWSYGIGPNLNTDVVIDPSRSAWVLGPTGTVSLKTLTVGGSDLGGNGIATLALQGGTISLQPGVYNNITRKGVLTGDGVIDGTIYNYGTVTAQNVTITRGLSNLGLINGSGRINANLVNGVTGTVRSGVGEQLLLNGAQPYHANYGTFDIHGGEVQIIGQLGNEVGGRILLGAGGRLTVSSGLINDGQLLVGFGGAEVFGSVITQAGGKVIFSGNSNTTLYDTVEVQGGGELRVSAGSTALFFGQVLQRTGAVFSGSGTKFYEGGLSIGASPGLGVDAGDVLFGAGNVYLAEIGGTTACTAACATDEAVKNHSFDKYVVQGRLGAGGTLKLVSWGSFVAQAGQSFDLLDWGSLSGSFAGIDISGLALAPGLVLDTSRLYVDGTVSVQAVPEPAGWALMFGGLAWLGMARQRARRQSRTDDGWPAVDRH
jgi:probable HAF family extracellular repeat protein